MTACRLSVYSFQEIVEEFDGLGTDSPFTPGGSGVAARTLVTDDYSPGVYLVRVARGGSHHLCKLIVE